MRDARWIALHRGGELTPEHHRALQTWAIACVEALFEAMSLETDDTTLGALDVASAWSEGKSKTGESMKTARALHKRAREQTNATSTYLLRATAHAVATAHAADHSLGSIIYGCKALAPKSCEDFVQTCRAKLDAIAPDLTSFCFEQLLHKTPKLYPHQATFGLSS